MPEYSEISLLLARNRSLSRHTWHIQHTPGIYFSLSRQRHERRGDLKEIIPRLFPVYPEMLNSEDLTKSTILAFKVWVAWHNVETRKLKLDPDEIMVFPEGSMTPVPDEATLTEIAGGKYGINSSDEPLVVIWRARKRGRRFWFWRSS